ncbi:hypothetical protein VDGL01_09623 [Verticillium dahliae]
MDAPIHIWSRPDHLVHVSPFRGLDTLALGRVAVSAGAAAAAEAAIAGAAHLPLLEVLVHSLGADGRGQSHGGRGEEGDEADEDSSELHSRLVCGFIAISC